MPLWLLYPGVGEILVFFDLADYITHQPVYALGSGGFDGEPLFKSIQNPYRATTTKSNSLQPKGPYAIAGYSYGTIVALGVSKLMKERGGEIGFRGIIDQPPHIKAQMCYSDWTSIVITLGRLNRHC